MTSLQNACAMACDCIHDYRLDVEYAKDTTDSRQKMLRALAEVQMSTMEVDDDAYAEELRKVTHKRLIALECAAEEEQEDGQE